MKPLHQRMLDAADTLEDASAIYEAFSPADYPWTATRLRDEAHHVKNEENP